MSIEQTVKYETIPAYGKVRFGDFVTVQDPRDGKYYHGLAESNPTGGTIARIVVDGIAIPLTVKNFVLGTRVVMEYKLPTQPGVYRLIYKDDSSHILLLIKKYTDNKGEWYFANTLLPYKFEGRHEDNFKSLGLITSFEHEDF